VLIESPEGDFLVPPIVQDETGRLMQGREVLATVVEVGVTVEHPVVYAATAADLAEIDQRRARISDELGVPILSSS
jgi:hypothetical protein